MRPLSTQRPERPKSELWHKKYEKCGLSKACDAACVCTGDCRHPCDGRKKSKTSTCSGSESRTIRSAVVLEYIACIDSPQGLEALVRSTNWSRRGRGRKSAEIPCAVRCYDRLQTSMPRGKP